MGHYGGKYVTLVGIIANVSSGDAGKIKFDRLTLSFLGVNDA
jgi:hypothetical protein